MLRRRRQLVAFGVIVGIALLVQGAFYANTSSVAVGDSRPPSAEHPLGTNVHDEDFLRVLAKAGISSLFLAASGICVAALVALCVATIGSRFGILVETGLVALLGAAMSIPMFLVLVALAPFSGDEPLLLFALAGALVAPEPALVLLEQMKSTFRRPYVLYSRAFGASRFRVTLAVLPRALRAPAVLLASLFPEFLALDVVLSLFWAAPAESTTLGVLVYEGLLGRHSGIWWLVWPPTLLLLVVTVPCALLATGTRRSFQRGHAPRLGGLRRG